MGLLAADRLTRLIEKDGLTWTDVGTREGPKFGPIPHGWLSASPIMRLGPVAARAFAAAPPAENLAATRTAVRDAIAHVVADWELEVLDSPLLARLRTEQTICAVFLGTSGLAAVGWDWQARDVYAPTDIMYSGPHEVPVEDQQRLLNEYQMARDAAGDDPFAVLRATGQLFARIAEHSAQTERPTVGPALDIGLVEPNGTRYLLHGPAKAIAQASEHELAAMLARIPDAGEPPGGPP